ncbi:SagB family peptide dehydrogenase [Lignipirellula cremea]|uniref:Nitroreductase family protein n=1 Tax=Lignipirellula cremea TaxID=2528010 RepID=A0A518DQP8_9BACT|nr:SagB family peptide dehydrogenase [Lignipirellula cremea]QDU94142.1 Nitroreductase family protein [Lignipirellula cremea]
MPVDDGKSFTPARLVYYLQQLARRQYLDLTVGQGKTPLASLLPTGPAFKITRTEELPDRFVLSRFANIRRQQAGLVLETPQASSFLLIHQELASRFLHHLWTPQTLASLQQKLPDISQENQAALLELLSLGGFLTAVDAAGNPHEDDDPGLMYWEYHDLQFHVSSRAGRHGQYHGGTYSFIDKAPAPPAVAPVPEGAVLTPLAVPDLAKKIESGPSLTNVIEKRKSIRNYDSQPLTAEQLGEFLYRVARVKEQYAYDVDLPGQTVKVQCASRPYPSAGALYELEFYPVVARCEGLEKGLYRYLPGQHQLAMLPQGGEMVDRLLMSGSSAGGVPLEEIQVLIVLSARFPRMMWKYSGMAYAAILKNVGVAYQTMYLVATDMGLAPCGLGDGDPDGFALATGCDYYQESSVGEFLLGRPAGGRTEQTDS